MSELARGQTVEYTPVEVKVTQCTPDAPLCWYRKYIGQTLKVRRKTWYQDGKVASQSYEMERTPDGGFNGHLMSNDVEEL